MKPVTQLRCLLIAAVWIVGARGPKAGETFSFGDKDDWTNPNLRVNADGSLGLTGGQLTYSAETFPVDTTATSKLSGQFKQLAGAGEKDRFFFAFLNFDKDMQRGRLHERGIHRVQDAPRLSRPAQSERQPQGPDRSGRAGTNAGTTPSDWDASCASTSRSFVSRWATRWPARNSSRRACAGNFPKRMPITSGWKWSVAPRSQNGSGKGLCRAAS